MDSQNKDIEPLIKLQSSIHEHIKLFSYAKNAERKKHFSVILRTETYALCNLITERLMQGAITSDPTGVIMGTTVFGPEVDTYAREWYESIKNQKTPDGRNLGQMLRQALHAATNAGHSTGPWQRVTLFFKDGSRIILEKGRHEIVIILSGRTYYSVDWVWDGRSPLLEWVKFRHKSQKIIPADQSPIEITTTEISFNQLPERLRKSIVAK